jgi:aspartyl-tRNA(Asn)/glutamyl-tRNA(Gln) amidotransferase subunit A
MTWTVEDCALVLQAIAGYDPADAGSIEAAIPDYRAALPSGIRGMRIGVLRHYWEQDMPAHEDLKRAMEDAIEVFHKLGAKIEDCRARPMMDSLDVKVIIAESELFSIHYRELIARPGDFGRDFLGRILPACLFQAADYVAASREHRRIIAEARALSEKHDVLLIPERLVTFADGKATVELPGASEKADPTKKEIKTGLSDGMNVEVAEGLQEKDVVIERPPKKIE